MGFKEGVVMKDYTWMSVLSFVDGFSIYMSWSARSAHKEIDFDALAHKMMMMLRYDNAYYDDDDDDKGGENTL